MTITKEKKIDDSIGFVLASQVMMNKAIEHRDEPDDDYVYYLKKSKECIDKAISIMEEYR